MVIEFMEAMRKAIKQLDQKALATLSDKYVHEASITQDEKLLALVVIAHSLSKLIEKKRIAKRAELGEMLREIDERLKAAIELMKVGDEKGALKEIRKISELIMSFDKKFSDYAIEVLSFSKSAKGKKLYEHGISLSLVADLLGISKWELMEKIGESTFHELTKTMSAKERLKKLEK